MRAHHALHRCPADARHHTTLADPPAFVPEVAYRPGGVLYSKDGTANMAVVTTQLGAALRTARFIALTPLTDAVLATSISLDLQKVQDGVFAGGAIVDPDTRDAPVSMTLKWVDDNAGALERSLNDLLSEKASSLAAATFTYSTSAPSTLALSVKLGATLQTLRFRLVISTSPSVYADFFVDIRTFFACTAQPPTASALHFTRSCVPHVVRLVQARVGACSRARPTSCC
ncbi:hypothetical protein EON66_03945 [archaeon]|nr:MAG: hypothetical protein EON66_03945 [archaeon]